jgi:hypothetical protein
VTKSGAFPAPLAVPNTGKVPAVINNPQVGAIQTRRNAMNDQNKEKGFDSKKQRYEAPKARSVRVKIAERLGTCTYTTPSLCGYTT